MSRKHYKKRKKKDKPAPDHIRGVTQMVVDPAVAEPKQITRGESIRPAVHGGYRHSFSYYEHTIPMKRGIAK